MKNLYPNVEFIYCPKSGDKVFIENPCPQIITYQWNNKSRHVIGGVYLHWWTATPNYHWRDKAIDALKEIVSISGGIAWDDCGDISVVLPAYYALQSIFLMYSISRNSLIDKQNSKISQISSLYQQGYASIVKNEDNKLEFSLLHYEEIDKEDGKIFVSRGVSFYDDIKEVKIQHGKNYIKYHLCTYSTIYPIIEDIKGGIFISKEEYNNLKCDMAELLAT